MTSEYIVVFMTAPNADDGARIGKAVVAERLAACCNVVPTLRSIYIWKDKLCDEAEAMCIFKTRSTLFEPLKKRIKELHSYDVPEIIAIEIKDGLPEYLAWIGEGTDGGQ